MPKTIDFLVAGGGPAGSMAAALFASRGNRVVLVERSSEPHHKVCGEFLSYEALRYLRDAGLDPWRLGAVPIRNVRLAADNLIAETALPFEAASLSRKVMDAALLQMAQEHGAHLLPNRQVERLSGDASGWSALLNDGQVLQADQAMLATGKHDLRGFTRGRGLQHNLVAFKMYMRLSAEQTRMLRETVEVVLFPGGYLGLQPMSNGVINLCLLIHKKKLRNIGGGWPGVLRHLIASSRILRERLTGAEEDFTYPLAVSSIPYGYVRKESQSGLWALGDQTAVIPSFSGDGIAIALHSAHHAAALHAAGHNADEYSRRMYDHHHARVTRATLLSKLMVATPQWAFILQYFPSLLQQFAKATRIPEDLLLTESSLQRSDA